MTAKMSERRRAAFLAALRATGNQTIAAERACLSRSWVSQQRAACTEFRRESDAAIAEAKVRLGAHPERRPPSGWGHLDGVELVVKGSKGRRVQIARARVGQITPAVEDRFLSVLAATCSVKAAHIEAGVNKGAIYTHRDRWAAFAKRWDSAVRIATIRLEFALVHYAANPFSATELPEPATIRIVPDPVDGLPGTLTVDEALHNLYMHQHATGGGGGKPGRVARPREMAEVAPFMLRKIEALRNAHEVSEAEMEESKREWERRRPSAELRA